MKKLLNLLLYGFALIGMGMVALQLYSHTAAVARCEEVVLARASAPAGASDARVTASVVNQQCTDLPSARLQLVLQHSDTPKQSRIAPLGDATTSDIDLTWLTERKLKIIYPATYQPTAMPRDIADVQLVWEKRTEQRE